MMPPGTALILIDGIHPYITYLPAFYDYSFHAAQGNSVEETVQRECKQSSFDFMEFVKDKKRKKVIEDIESRMAETEPADIRRPPTSEREEMEQAAADLDALIQSLDTLMELDKDNERPAQDG